MITKEQLKDEIDTVEDAQTLELVYQLLLKIKQGVTPNKPTLASLAGCWEGERLERENQGDYDVRREL
jgi:hypothetical protein